MNYIIFAGPQAAGKSTTKKYLEDKYSNRKQVIFLEESRHIINKKYNSGGSLTVTKNLELEYIKEDMKRLKTLENKIKGNKNLVYVDETSIFSLAHSRLQDIKIEERFKEYMDILKKLNSHVIFLNALPESSWDRRKEKYEKRVEGLDQNERKDAMKEFRKYLHYVYPELIKMFEKIDLPKTKLNTEINLISSVKNTEKVFLELLNKKTLSKTQNTTKFYFK